MHSEYDNPTLRRLKNGEITYGMFILSATPICVETCATIGFDWLVLDMEASPVDRRDVFDFMAALKVESTHALVRVPRNEHTMIEQVLDLGVPGLIIPKVNTVEDALRAVNAVRFPPEGDRGLNPVRASRYFSDVPGYLDAANRNTALFVQIESAKALENLEEIASVQGVDGLFVGCGDLALSLGCLGDMGGAVMRDAIQRIAEACVKYDKIAGVFAYGIDLAKEYRQMGYKFIAVGNDIKALRDGCESVLAAVKD